MTQIFIGRIPFLSWYRLCQSTEGNSNDWPNQWPDLFVSSSTTQLLRRGWSIYAGSPMQEPWNCWLRWMQNLKKEIFLVSSQFMNVSQDGFWFHGFMWFIVQTCLWNYNTILEYCFAGVFLANSVGKMALDISLFFGDCVCVPVFLHYIHKYKSHVKVC